MPSKSLILKLIFNTTLGVVAVFSWLNFVNFEEIKHTLATTTKPVWFIAIFIFLWLSIAIRGYKLKIFLSPIKKVKTKEMVILNGVASLLNFLIPIRAGEITKGIYLSRFYGIPASRSLVWIFLDRFIDFLTILILSPIFLLLVPNNLDFRFIFIIVGLCTFLILITYLMVFQRRGAQKLFEFFTHFLVFSSLQKHFKKLYLHFLDSFVILKRSPKDLLFLFLVSSLAYVTDAFVWYFAFLSIGSVQSYMKMFLAQLISATTYLFPAAPGYVGSAEASGLVVFSGVLGIDKNLSSAMTLIFHSSAAIVIIVYGILCLYLLKINPEDLLRKVLKKD